MDLFSMLLLLKMITNCNARSPAMKTIFACESTPLTCSLKSDLGWHLVCFLKIQVQGKWDAWHICHMQPITKYIVC